MHEFLIQLRIGEKIGLGFGLVGLLFLGVIWQYQHTLNQSLTDYRVLINVHGQKKDHLRAIEGHLLQARLDETRFLLAHRSADAEAAREQIRLAEAAVARLAETDPEERSRAVEFGQHLKAYLDQFNRVEQAWIERGLNEETGLQGSFRNAVHDLQSMASHLNADRVYLDLLQIRRSEKDLGLRREPEYRQRVQELLGTFEEHLRASTLLPEVREQLLTELASYRDAFESYADKVLAGEPIDGGKGPFRDAAHRLEDLIRQYYVPDLERDLLQLRRREKDYLLRGEEKYVQMVQEWVAHTRDRIQASGVNAAERERFLSLLQRYQADFAALVEQNRRIDGLTGQMELTATQVTGLVKREVEGANRAIADLTASINLRAEERTRWMLWVVALAIGLGVLFAVRITAHIVVPMRKMAALLERLTYTELVTPVRHVEGGRDEVNAMAGYLNTLAEHRNRFINWWRSSMNETEACEQLQRILDHAEQEDSDAAIEVNNIRRELVEAMEEKKRLLGIEFAEMERQLDKVLNASAQLLHPSIGRGDVDEQARAIHYAAELMRKSLRMLGHGRQAG